MVNLSVKIGKLKLKNPVMVASGTFGEAYDELMNIRTLGAIVSKTITLKARTGNPPPRVAETASGMLNSIGLENKGLDDFIKNKLPALRKFKVPVIVSISGDDGAEFSELAKRLYRTGLVNAIELNLSCPNVKHGKRDFLMAQDEKTTYQIVKAVRRSVSGTIIAKLSPNVTDIAKIALSAESAGADAVLLVNTFFGMAIDVNTRKPKLGNILGGVSGPVIKPMALRMVWQAYNKIKIPIIGAGGITNHNDAIEYILCGARAIQVGTANFVNPKAPNLVLAGIKDYLVKNKIGDINKLVGGIVLEDKSQR